MKKSSVENFIFGAVDGLKSDESVLLFLESFFWKKLYLKVLFSVDYRVKLYSLDASCETIS